MYCYILKSYSLLTKKTYHCAVCVLHKLRQVLSAGFSSGLTLTYGLTNGTRPSIQIKVPLLSRIEGIEVLVGPCFLCMFDMCMHVYVFLCVHVCENVSRAGYMWSITHHSC